MPFINFFLAPWLVLFSSSAKLLAVVKNPDAEVENLTCLSFRLTIVPLFL